MMLRHVSRRSFSVLVLAEHDAGQIGQGTLAAVTAAKKLNAGPVTVLVSGSDTAAAEAASKINGVDNVLVAKDAKYDHAVAEQVSALVVSLHKQNKYTHILGTASNEGKNIIPRAAALLDVQPISDIIDVVSGDTFVRPVYAGNALATVQSSDEVKIMTVRPTAFEKAAAQGGSATTSDAPAPEGPSTCVTWKEDQVAKSDRPELASAKRVVSGGRGMKSGENFDMLYKLADKMGAAVGASRAAVDSGFVPNDMQIGQTGKVVAPELYIAFGLSGAVQHLAGMKDSKVICCVNKDPEAPIFQVSDYGLEADLFKVVPEMTDKL